MTIFAKFADAQAGSLRGVHDRASLAEWHAQFASAWAANAVRLASSANEAFDLAGQYAIRPDVGYLAVERRLRHHSESAPWILVSANPSWGEAVNEQERRVKGHPDVAGPIDLATYQAYRTNFFDRWYPEVMQAAGKGANAGWWNKAAGVLHDLQGLTKPRGRMSLHPDFDAIGWELWPFHSPKDGLTGLLDQRQGAVLATFAVASLEAALRMSGVAAVLAASKAALRVVASLSAKLPAGALVRDPRRSGTLIHEFSTRKHGRAKRVAVEVERYTYAPTGRRLVVIGRQIFSNFGSLPSVMQAELLDVLREDRPLGPRPASAPIGASLGAGPRPAKGTQAPRGADISRCIALGHTDERGPVIVAVPVGETEFLDAPELLDDEDMHLRTVGFWKVKADGPVVTAVRDALSNGRRAFVMSRCGGALLRLYEIRAGRDDAAPESFVHHDTETYNREAQQPRGVMLAGGEPFATAYRHGGTTRIRFHAVECDDELLRGLPIDSTVQMSAWPRTCTFAAMDDLRVLPLFA